MASVSVTVPATTSNLGPAFDCLGLALSLRNTTTIESLDRDEFQITVEGEGADRLPHDRRNLVVQAAESLFERAGWRPPGLKVHQVNRIPVGSGLGSSAAAALGGIVAANRLAGSPLDQDQLLAMAVAREGHPDNVSPALFGGCTLTISEPDQLYVEKIDVPPLRVLVVLPDFRLDTADARAALPPSVALPDAVFNIGRAALLVRALADGDLERLAMAVADRLHQPYRLPLIPGMAAAFAAIRSAGQRNSKRNTRCAHAVALSGAGPSLIVFADRDHDLLASLAIEAFAAAGLKARSWLLPVDDQGATISDNQV